MLPSTDGGARAMYELARSIKKNGVDVGWATLSNGMSPPALSSAESEIFDYIHWGPYTGENSVLRLLWSLTSTQQPYSIWKCRSAEFEVTLIDLVRNKKPDFVLCEHLHTAQYARQLKKMFPHLPVILREHNAEYRIMERNAAQGSNIVERLVYGIQAKRLRKYEADAIQWSDKVLTLSSVDASALAKIQPEILGRIDVVLPGVHEISSLRKLRPRRGHIRLLHFAAMDWKPNEDGLRWLLGDVIPALERRGVSFTLDIVGKAMPQWVYRCERSPHVRVRGFVESLEDVYSEVDLALVAVQAGSGIRIKILEHAAWGIPVASTRVGAEGLINLECSGVLVSNSASEFADAIAVLSEQPERLVALSERGREWVSCHYSSDAAGRRVVEVAVAAKRLCNG